MNKTQARRRVVAIRREVRDYYGEGKRAELDALARLDALAVKAPRQVRDPNTGKVRRQWQRGEYDFLQGRPFWETKILVGGPNAVYHADELLDILQGAGALSETEDLSTWADRVLSASVSRKLTIDEAAELTGEPVGLLEQILTGDAGVAADALIAWEADHRVDLASVREDIRARAKQLDADIAAFSDLVRVAHDDGGRTWADIGRELGVSHQRAYQLAFPKKATPTYQADTEVF